MKQRSIVFIIIVLFTIAGMAVSAEGNQETGNGYGNGRGQGNGQGYGRGNGQGRGQGAGNGIPAEDFRGELAAVLADAAGGQLSAAAKADLLRMREEEKLARDVYAKLYSVWSIPVFRNIGSSEQQHMDAVLDLLKTYNLKDPVEGLPEGRFATKAMQDLYDSLVKKGSASIADAFTVGATVEDLDIADLAESIEASDNDDVRILYQNLQKGSRNHLRSFTAQLDREGRTYTPSHIAPAYYAVIMKLNREQAVITDPEYHL